MPSATSKRSSPAACTIITRCYLSHARILIESYHRHEPGGRFYLVVVDGLPQGATAGADVVMITPEELEIPCLHELLFKYDLVEFCTSIKPTLLAMLMKRFDETQVLYIDPDIMLARPLDEVVAALQSSSIVLTPHLLRPHELDGRHPSDQDILMAGAFNLGFIALAKSTQTMDFLRWWEERLKEGCRIDPATGLMTDQKWIDLVPGLFSQTHILRDDTYNVAYWNINARRIIRCGNQFLVNARPLAFFHFSNFDPNHPLAFSRDHGREKVIRGTGVADLLELYARLQIDHGYRTCIQWKYQRATFDNGVPVTAPVRKLYLSLPPSTRIQFGNPFVTADESSFYHWAITPRSDRHGLSPFLMHLYQSRLDLQGAFPDLAGADAQRFIEWAQKIGPQETGFDPQLAGMENPPVSDDTAVEYSQLVTRLKQVVGHTLPPGAVVSVISKGDRDLLDLEGRSTRHFPESPSGEYAGYYPSDGVDALNQLLAQIQRGAEYLIVPATALWWLDHYAEFDNFLSHECRVITDEPGICRIFALGETAAPTEQSALEQIEGILHQRAAQVAELTTENLRLRSKVRELEMIRNGRDVDDVKVFWRPDTSRSQTNRPEPALPRVVMTGDRRWLSHDATGRLVSIILPVRMGVESLAQLLPRLVSQKSGDFIEVIAFLVGSTDPAKAPLEQFGATAIELAQGDPLLLNCSAARKLAARHARGKILIFLGEGTVPADENWLANLLSPLDRDAQTAGACSALVRIPEHLEPMTEFHLHSTAIRADVFRSTLSDDYGLADGRAWAQAVMSAGFSIVFEPRSMALHAPRSQGILDDFRRGISDGMLDQQPPETTLVPADPASQQTALTVGRWLGRYLQFTAAGPGNASGGS